MWLLKLNSLYPTGVVRWSMHERFSLGKKLNHPFYALFPRFGKFWLSHPLHLSGFPMPRKIPDPCTVRALDRVEGYPVR